MWWVNATTIKSNFECLFQKHKQTVICQCRIQFFHRCGALSTNEEKHFFFSLLSLLFHIFNWFIDRIKRYRAPHTRYYSIVGKFDAPLKRCKPPWVVTQGARPAINHYYIPCERNLAGNVIVMVYSGLHVWHIDHVGYLDVILKRIVFFFGFSSG